MVLDFNVFEPSSFRNFVFGSILENFGERSSWNIQCLEELCEEKLV